MVQGGRVMTLGDCVELCLMPGDEAPRVARLQALWSQAAMDGCQRMFAQCCYFYRPSVRLPAACSYQTVDPQMMGLASFPVDVWHMYIEGQLEDFRVVHSSSTLCQEALADGAFYCIAN